MLCMPESTVFESYLLLELSAVPIRLSNVNMLSGFLVFKMLIFFLATFNYASAEWIDMSYIFSNETVYWPGLKSFNHTLVHVKGICPAGYYYALYDISANEHGGTHTDAPSHFAEDGLSLDKVPLTSLIGPAVVVNISEKAARNQDYRLSVQDLEDWERNNGKIPDGAIVLLYSGWGKFYPNETTFFRNNSGNVPSLHFPGFDPEAAEWIVNNGKIKAIGLDTASLDYGQSKAFPSHGIFGKANIPGFEMVANLDKLPPRGAAIYAAVLKFKGGSGGPTRIFAEIKKGENNETRSTKTKWLDMTHSLINGTVYWPGQTPFSLRQSYHPNRTRDGFYFRHFEYTASEHCGTHLVAPIHFAEGKRSTHELTLDDLIGQAVKIDISDKAAQNSAYQLKVSDIEEWEQKYTKIQEGVIVLVYTGWGKYFYDRSKYLGLKADGNKSLNFPGIHPDAAKWLVKRKVKAVGLDTASLDYGPSKDFSSQQILSKANIPGLKNVANLDELPATGATVFAPPMKIKDGSGGPVRMFAMIHEMRPTSGAGIISASIHLLVFIATLWI